jgi:hypothetical protein
MGPEHCLSVRFFSVDGVLLARFFSVEGVRSARSFSSDGVLLVRFSVDGVLLERFFSVDPALLIIVAGVLSVELFTDIRSIHSGWSGSFRLLLSSVPDPDSHALGPPGSGSISQRYGSGSFYHQAKIVRKTTFIPTVLSLRDFFWTFYLWKMYLQKVINRKLFKKISFLLAP